MDYIQSFGQISSPTDVRDYVACEPVGIQFPDKFELEHPIIKNQGTTGSCVAHSLSCAIQYFNHKQENDNTVFSTDFIYGNRRNSNHKGPGMIVREALQNVKKFGDIPKEKLSGNKEVPNAISYFEEHFDELADQAYKNRITSYYRLNSDNEIKKCLMDNGPVIFAMEWRKNTTVKNGILTYRDTDPVAGGHCMYIYGWNEHGWLVQNSWGYGWGYQGTCILPFDKKRTETWGVTDDIVNNNIKKPFSSPIGNIIAVILNFFQKIIKVISLP